MTTHFEQSEVSSSCMGKSLNFVAGCRSAALEGARFRFHIHDHAVSVPHHGTEPIGAAVAFTQANVIEAAAGQKAGLVAGQPVAAVMAEFSAVAMV
jgi:hypothetical protein